MTDLPSAAELPEHADFVVFGATGDLALRKLLPALFQRDREGQLPDGFRIVGVSRTEADDDGFRALVADALVEHVPASELDAATVQRLLGRLRHLTLDALDPADWHRLAGLLKDDAPRAPEVDPASVVRVFYLAVAPSLFGPICQQLDRAGLVTPLSRVVLEKPLGHDLASSRAINDAVGEVFAEPQIFRIDHYLGKESVQNLLVTRFANTLLEPLWSSRWIDHVEITVAESLGVGERGGYYDQAGALRDMVQNHLLQLLCLVAMEPPTYVGRENVRDEKLKVLQALRPLGPADVDRDVVRGQYVGSGQGDRAYAEEVADGATTTETFVAIRAEISNWRWAGVPFYLRTGKRMSERTSQIVVQFKEPPHAMFPGAEGAPSANRLHILVQPEEGMRLHLTAKEPGPGGIRLKPVSLDLSYAAAFGRRTPEAYERLLMDVVRGNPTLFMRRDEVEAAWTWVAPILEAWRAADAAGARPLPYPAGSTGPAAADALLGRDGRTWQELDR
ncbi:glucose-6-phosphate dehydrogenase [Nocardioides sp. TRM66260-LWL]|uniref:glucose-6-phosphate dehydrogenase n=1 Tax=Nocardioides sp. TRM66260-LWL TaxID=2874478 RepID=UPI001CC420B1|nr:glucose-6-phosphate dehydrogenase [Nocardioides sp. TRM66260-LWL]MBZ5736057.1 glucose-6-phosphate dehydrogenase [Nocardioides sp. TRM66260-LWL]